MATFRKRKNKWQAIVRHKDIGTVAKSFRSKTSAMQWAVEQETNLEGETFGKLNPSKVTLDNLLHRYCREVTVSKRGKETELRRLRRLIKDHVSCLTIDKLTSQSLADFRDRRLKDGKRACYYDLVLIKHCLKIATHEWGLMLSSNPVDFIKMPPTQSQGSEGSTKASMSVWSKRLI